MQLTFSHLSIEQAIERYGRELERKEAIKDRYRSPPRRDKSRQPGTTYVGPHRPNHKVAAVQESSEDGSSESETKPRREKKVKQKLKESEIDEVAAVTNKRRSEVPNFSNYSTTLQGRGGDGPINTPSPNGYRDGQSRGNQLLGSRPTGGSPEVAGKLIKNPGVPNQPL